MLFSSLDGKIKTPAIFCLCIICIAEFLRCISLAVREAFNFFSQKFWVDSYHPHGIQDNGIRMEGTPKMSSLKKIVPCEELYNIESNMYDFMITPGWL